MALKGEREGGRMPLRTATVMTDETEEGALFVDFENVYFALVNGRNFTKEDALTHTIEVLAELRECLRDEGCVMVVERCYADWEQVPTTAQRQLQVSGLLPRYTESRVAKSTADIELSLDILQHVTSRPELKRIVLVGGDRDYLPVLRRIKEQNKTVQVCSLRACLSGDVREFVGNYARAAIVELDELLKAPATPDVPKAASPSPPTAPKPRPTPAHFEPHEWHERYVTALIRFLNERGYCEAHLSPFFRWLEAERVFELVSHREQRRLLEDLKKAGAIVVEEREAGNGITFAAATLNWNHELVRTLNAG